MYTPYKYCHKDVYKRQTLHNRLEIINLQSIKDKAITKIKKYH